MRFARWLLVMGLVLFFGADALAAKCEGTGVWHKNSAKVAGTKLVLNGMGIREATILKVNVYVAALYLKSKTQDGAKAINMDGPKKLVLKFVRDVDKADITKAWTESSAKNGGLPGNTLAKVNGWMSDVKVGQKMIFSYAPGKGTMVKVAGSKKGVIKGDAFIKQFLKIWLGTPPNPGLKDGLLGKIKCED